MTSKETLLIAGERLMAERGVDVPLRDIAEAAGHRNNSAVHYHFGSRENLVMAILQFRAEPQDAQRLRGLGELEAKGVSNVLQELVDLLIRPFCEVPYAQGATHHARFLAQVYNHPRLADLVFDPASWGASNLIVQRIYRLLGDLPPAFRRRRIKTIQALGITFMADHERRTGPDVPAAPESELVDDLISSTVGMLTAPILDRV